MKETGLKQVAEESWSSVASRTQQSNDKEGHWLKLIFGVRLQVMCDEGKNVNNLLLF